ncbi:MULTISPECIES: Lrp/AsnC family transcriptional regulator [Pseudomonas]|uniref:AsnC family transcriptional regulator n=3 Tax=Pseudomonas TaxID=286 RepID=A0A0G3GLU0_9PSED|nr:MULTISPECIES: Lrp/AsnC family transcriptional regulator [Pseudomonas]AKK00513.1 AsnC family transcriptional regulator [Pseudomonas chlororaphis]KIQ57988.1 AsnC family transcriptional regulator [Pseudomonas fluorescens]ROM83280.1 AsnC family transcriptional regulator [Pseudomonas brassicacearum]BBP65060.1 AsnC family transcriptional regulator [Pseudomonas sp. Cab53]
MKRVLDKVDEKILEALTRNARLSHNDIAMKVNLSRNAVRLRIERLERDGYVRGYTIVKGMPSNDTGPIKALIFVYRKERMRDAEVVRCVVSMPEVISCNVMSGDWDLVLTVEAINADRIHKVWAEISALPGVLNTVTSFVLSSAK